MPAVGGVCNLQIHMIDKYVYPFKNGQRRFLKATCRFHLANFTLQISPSPPPRLAGVGSILTPIRGVFPPEIGVPPRKPQKIGVFGGVKIGYFGTPKSFLVYSDFSKYPPPK